MIWNYSLETNYFGLIHDIIIETEKSWDFVKEEVEVVVDSLETARDLDFVNFVFDFPDEAILNMIIFYKSDGKYKDIIEKYSVNISNDSNTKIYIKLKDICHNITHKEIANLTFSSLRTPMWWEDKKKMFYVINGNPDVVRENISNKSIMKCYYNYNVYYFNIGIEEPEITEDMIHNAEWFVYDWKKA